jgi:hypothetical protein
MKIVTLVKEEALTTGGGFSLEKAKPRSWQVLIEQAGHELIYILLSQRYANGKNLSDHISRSSIVERKD